jgi:hypothetical protein
MDVDRYQKNTQTRPPYDAAVIEGRISQYDVRRSCNPSGINFYPCS